MGAKTVADLLLISSTLILLYVNIFFNYNTCLSYNNAFENIFGIRGYAFLNFYYSILMAVEFNFGGLPNNKQSNVEEINDGNQQNAEEQKTNIAVVTTDQL